MRKYIDAITLMESITFHPAVMQEEDGRKLVTWPEGTVEKVEIDCRDCEGTGNYESQGGRGTCRDCMGSGKEMETVYNLPEMNVSNQNAGHILEMLGIEFDYAGWIPHEMLPDLRRKLIMLKNTDRSRHTIEPSMTQHVAPARGYQHPSTVNRGPKMYDPGFTDSYIVAKVDRLLELIDYAQKGGYGLSWG